MLRAVHQSGTFKVINDLLTFGKVADPRDKLHSLARVLIVPKRYETLLKVFLTNTTFQLVYSLLHRCRNHFLIGTGAELLCHRYQSILRAVCGAYSSFQSYNKCYF